MKPDFQNKPASTQFHPESRLYSEQAVWLCRNKKTGFATRIHGGLAQILQQYPDDYKLKFLFTSEVAHEHPTATGQ
jgi:hypothetical protein